MKRRLMLIAAVILCVVPLACQPGATGLTEQDKAEIRSVDEPVRQTMLSEKPDWAAMVATLYAPDIELLPPDGPIVKGLDAAEAFYSQWMPVKDFKVTEDRLEGTGQFAFRRTSLAVTVAPPGAPELVTVRGKDIVVLRKEADGKWKAIAEIWNNDAPSSDITVPTASVAPDASVELKKLGDIVGRWKLDGTWKSDPKAAAGLVDLELSCAWFAGGHQVVYRLGGTIAGAAHEEMGAYAYDSKTKAYIELSLGSGSDVPGSGVVTIKPGTWLHTYDIQVGGRVAKAHFIFSNMSPAGGDWKYEISVGGGPWTVTGEGKYTKAN